MKILNFLVNQIFREAPLFLGIIALVGLLLQKKSASEVIEGTFKTIIGVVILTQGTNILTSAIAPVSDGFTTLYGVSGEATLNPIGADELIARYGSEIGLTMLLAFLINVFVARYTKFKNVFLTGHHLFWFAFIFVAVGVETGLAGGSLILFSTIFLAVYLIFAPAVIKPYVKEVIGDDSFTLGHPTVILSLVSGFLGKIFGNKEHSTEDLKIGESWNFLREITITSAIVIFVVYLVVGALLGGQVVEVFDTEKSLGVYALMQGVLFGAGLSVLLAGVRMMLNEIIPAFKGISDKIIPDAIPALDCPIIFAYAPNAVLIGFVVSMITSVITIIIVGKTGLFPYAILPLTITCFFEIGTAAVIGNGTGGLKGAIIGSAVAGVLMIFLVGFSIPFISKTVADWIVIFGGNDFSLWAIISGGISKLLGIGG